MMMVGGLLMAFALFLVMCLVIYAMYYWYGVLGALLMIAFFAFLIGGSIIFLL